MKHSFIVELETNSLFIDCINNNLEYNKRANPERTFEDEVRDNLHNMVEDAIISQNGDFIDRVSIKDN